MSETQIPDSIYMLKIFQGIEKQVVDKIIFNCEEKKYSQDEMIIIEWEESNGNGYILKSWRVAISIKWQQIAELWEGDMFWEIALLNEEKRTATITALTDIEVILLTLNDLIEMINNDANKINKEILKRLEANIAR